LVGPPGIASDVLVGTFDTIFYEPGYIVTVNYATDLYVRYNPFRASFNDPAETIVDFMVLPVGAVWNGAIGDGSRKVTMISVFAPPGSTGTQWSQSLNACDSVDLVSAPGLTLIHLKGQVYIRSNQNIVRLYTEAT
jgi:hypothetical protein